MIVSRKKSANGAWLIRWSAKKIWCCRSGWRCSFSIGYCNMKTDVQSASRRTPDATDTVTLALSLVVSQAHARSIAEIQLANRWAERSSVTLQLPMAYAALEPGDLLQLNDGAFSHDIRIAKVQIGKPGVVKITGAIDAAEVSDRYIVPVIGSGATSVTPKASTQMVLLDIPALPSDLEDSLTLRFAGCGLSTGWTGASVSRIFDSGGKPVAVVADDTGDAGVGDNGARHGAA